MPLNTLQYQVEARVATITLHRPSRMNALNRELLGELDGLLDQLANDETVRAVILTGTERFFAAGADLEEVSAVSTVAEAIPFAARPQAVLSKLAALPQPVIAAVSGVALGGGCELCLACDIRIAAENASFGLPEIKLGLIPGAGGTQRLPRLIGLGRAKELLFSGGVVDAQEAYRLGLVNRVVPAERLLEEAGAFARKLADLPPIALRTLKSAVNQGHDRELPSGLAHESRCFASLFGTDDQKEGVRAFREKRKPEFKGC